jgi:hypothetical protein
LSLITAILAVPAITAIEWIICTVFSFGPATLETDSASFLNAAVRLVLAVADFGEDFL